MGTKESVAALIAEHSDNRNDTSIIVRKREAGVYDPDTGAVTTVTSDFIVPVKLDSFSVREVDGQNIRLTDYRLYVAAASLTERPTEEWMVVKDGAEHGVFAVREIPEKGVIVLYELWVRGT